MYGEKLDKLICVKCRICGRFTAIRLDPADLDRHVRGGIFVQFAFADRSGKPYLSASDRELLLSAVCRNCWDLLCPSSPLAYS